jgi:hypothetical protein
MERNSFWDYPLYVTRRAVTETHAHAAQPDGRDFQIRVNFRAILASLLWGVIYRCNAVSSRWRNSYNPCFDIAGIIRLKNHRNPQTLRSMSIAQERFCVWRPNRAGVWTA